MYGLKNGDKILLNVAKWLGEFLENKGIYNFPLGHVKGGDFIIGLEGDRYKYNILIELICLKSADFKIDNIELKISGAITDTNFSKDLDYLIENLYDIQDENRSIKYLSKDEEINPNELELAVIDAIKNRSFEIMTQDVFEDGKKVIKECFVKLKTKKNRFIHQKKYMKIINKLGLTIELDYMIFEEIVKKSVKFNNTILALTISPTSLRNVNFFYKARELLNDKTDKKIIFLISEFEYYSQIDKYNQILKNLRDNGILIAIDRLGSIHTSFLYLRDLEIDIVRFDGFYSKESKIYKYKNILDGFNTMAHDKGLKTWIKMIENEDAENIANELNIDYLQGKFLADLQKYEE
jgi:EAL domain-containing protein (putative c-di-GMP-specific phosphodiesterase class I)